jgi:hypothetical protein
MSAQAPLLVRIRPRWLQLRNQQALLLPGRSVGHISILSQTFNHIESTFRDPGSNVGIVAPTLGVAPAGPGREEPECFLGTTVQLGLDVHSRSIVSFSNFDAAPRLAWTPWCAHSDVRKFN